MASAALVDYRAYNTELTSVAETAAGVLPTDTSEVRQKKLHDWNASGGLLKALTAGKFDVNSKVLPPKVNPSTGVETPTKLSDVFYDRVALDATGEQYDSDIVRQFKADPARGVPAAESRGLARWDNITDDRVKTAADLTKLHYVPSPNRDPWGTAKARVNSLVITWNGVGWESKDNQPYVPVLNSVITNAFAPMFLEGFDPELGARIDNYLPEYQWSATTTKGRAVIKNDVVSQGDAYVAVLGLADGETTTVTVTCVRPGADPGSTSFTATARN